VKIGMIGLGKMGGNMAERLRRHQHVVVGMDPAKPEADAHSLQELVPLLAADGQPKVAWSMVPAGPITDSVITELGTRLAPGDLVIDGGNSNYLDSIRHGQELHAKGIHFVDCGTSGGVWGLERGYCLMIGGPDEAVDRLNPIWRSVAPGVGDVERTPGRSGDFTPEEQGWLHCGGNGAGHFVKMVHNGIEYGMMAAYAEGLNILKNADAGMQTRTTDAETAPMENPQYYQFDIDTAAVAEVWRRGSVVASWLLDLTAIALHASPDLEEFGGRVSDSGEGRWTSMAAIDEGVPAPVLTAALYSRFASQGNDEFANKVQSAMRKQFGGHDEKQG